MIDFEKSLGETLVEFSEAVVSLISTIWSITFGKAEKKEDDTGRSSD